MIVAQTATQGRILFTKKALRSRIAIWTHQGRPMSTAQPQFPEGADVESLGARLQPLLAGSGGRWTLTATGEGVERSFKFKTFAKTWDFMTAVSLQCKIRNHHPEWSNVYNTTFIRWTTHNPKGLSAKDVDLAAVCDSVARDFGEIAEAPEGDAAGQMQALTDAAVSKSGHCCGPKGQ